MVSYAQVLVISLLLSCCISNVISGCTSGYPLVCRGGMRNGEIIWTISGFTGVENTKSIQYTFNKGLYQSGAGGYNNNLPQGYCTWEDRGIATNEPNALYLMGDAICTTTDPAHPRCSALPGDGYNYYAAQGVLDLVNGDDVMHTFCVNTVYSQYGYPIFVVNALCDGC